MNREWALRLKRALTKKGWSAVELARRSGVDKESVYQYLRGGVKNPGGERIEQLARALEVDPLWLLTGHAATMTAGAKGEAVLLTVVPVMRLSSLRQLQSLDDLAELPPDDGTIPIPDTVGPRAGAVKLEDDSMGPAFPAGTLVVYDPDLEPIPGRFVVAVVNTVGAAVFRRWSATSPDGRFGDLLPDNPHYPLLRLQTEADGFVVGRAVMVVSRV